MLPFAAPNRDLEYAPCGCIKARRRAYTRTLSGATMPTLTPLELREMSRRLRVAAHAIDDLMLKRQVAEAALTLAELAEALDRQGDER